MIVIALLNLSKVEQKLSKKANRILLSFLVYISVLLNRSSLRGRDAGHFF
jgi:hypothetical protein